MKLTTEPTKHIIVKANTQSEWDNISYAIISLDLDKLQSVCKHAQELHKALGPSFWNIQIFDYSAVFVTDTDEGDDVEDVIEMGFEHLGPNVQWSYIDITQEEIDNWPRPESRLDAPTLRITGDGDISYTCYGKHTSEEFSTEEVNIKELIPSLQPTQS